jgi:hypothetical protein
VDTFGEAGPARSRQGPSPGVRDAHPERDEAAIEPVPGELALLVLDHALRGGPRPPGVLPPPAPDAVAHPGGSVKRPLAELLHGRRLFPRSGPRHRSPARPVRGCATPMKPTIRLFCCTVTSPDKIALSAACAT